MPAARTIEEVREAIRELERHGDDGCCMCGEDMDTHSDPMGAGHNPTSAFEYYMTLLQEELQQAKDTQIVQTWIETLPEGELAERAWRATKRLGDQ